MLIDPSAYYDIDSCHMFYFSRYGEKLKLTRNEGYKKSFFSNLILGAVYFVIFSTYALSLWSVPAQL